MTSEKTSFVQKKRKKRDRHYSHYVSYRSFWVTVERCFNWPNLFTVGLRGGERRWFKFSFGRGEQQSARQAGTRPLYTPLNFDSKKTFCFFENEAIQ